jgi:hypothetical protein
MLRLKVDRVYFKPEKDELVFVFTAKIIGGKMQLTEEADKIDYFFASNLPANIAKKHIERISDTVNFKNKTVFKIQ